jgi:hypothetical protein
MPNKKNENQGPGVITYYPGLPAEISPAEGEWFKKNMSEADYEAAAPIIKERVAAYKEPPRAPDSIYRSPQEIAKANEKAQAKAEEGGPAPAIVEIPESVQGPATELAPNSVEGGAK